MTFIPTCEISKPQFHTDSLGYTFVWDGHFLRGIFPESIELAKSYFETGLIDEITRKGLFPKTWISEFENEQFGLIIEHEFIKPVLYATEWNFEMLKDAALMVLELAQIAWKYGFNMVDCHKRNVLFKDNKPVFVDIGSFIPKEEGSTGWNPYLSYLHSYYYVLSLWSSGASVLAKRMMAPSVELDDKDYLVFKSHVFRKFPGLIKYYSLLQGGVCRIAAWGDQRIFKEPKIVQFLKPIIDFLKPSRSQRLHSMERKVKKIRNSGAHSLPQETNENINGFVCLILNSFPDAKSITFINSLREGYFESILANTNIEQLISIQENEEYSNVEYLKTRNQQLCICSCHLRIKDNTILVRNQFPEDRLRSDIVFVPQFNVLSGNINVLRSVGFIELYLDYAKEAIVLGIHGDNKKIEELLRTRHKVIYVPNGEESANKNGYLVVYR